MPFNSAGLYTPPSGATTAAPGDVIRSATWNSIFTDISSALTLLGEQLYGSTTFTGATVAPAATDTFLLINRAGAVTVNLPTIASRAGYPIRIKDISGAAQTNNITITANGSERIEGLVSVVIDVAFGGYFLFPVTSVGWVILP